MIQAVIFDMDGLLIDSEPFWRQAQVNVFKRVNFPMTIEKAKETQGIRIDEVVSIRFNQQPWDESIPGHSQADIVNAVIDEVVRLIETEGTPMEGVSHVLALVKSLGLKIGLATSSSMRIVNAVLNTLHLQDVFEIKASAEVETHGKPHPAVYLTAADMLNMPPEKCVAIEDSVSGMVAGAAAKMKTIVVPEKGQFDDPRFGLATHKVNTLLELTAEHFSIK